MKKDLITGQLIFFSSEESAFPRGKPCARYWNDGAGGEIKKFLKSKPADIAETVKKAQARAITLDNRPLWPHGHLRPAFVNVEASMQVAHAVSTHALDLESDYFTAVDDLLTGQDETGAGMIGDIDFDSCCYYQYASLDMDKLRENLKDSPEALARVDELLPVLLRVMALRQPPRQAEQLRRSRRSRRDAGRVQAEKFPPQSTSTPSQSPSPAIPRRSSRTAPTRLAQEVDLMDDFYALPVAHRAWMALSLGDPRRAPASASRQLCGTPRRLRGLGQGVTAMKLLILRLEGALQSWGERSHLGSPRYARYSRANPASLACWDARWGWNVAMRALPELADALAFAVARRPPRHGDDGLSYRAEPVAASF